MFSVKISTPSVAGMPGAIYTLAILWWTQYLTLPSIFGYQDIIVMQIILESDVYNMYRSQL